MPIIKSAKKKVTQDKKRASVNRKYLAGYKKVSQQIKQGTKGADSLKKLFQSVDKASKKGVIHKKKAARMKANFSKLMNKGKKTLK